jgi:hypothetical protein
MKAKRKRTGNVQSDRVAKAVERLLSEIRPLIEEARGMGVVRRGGRARPKERG